MANKYTNRDLLDFNYQQSDKVNLAEQQKTAAEQALKNYGPYNFTYNRQADYDSAIDAILNRKQFSYDLNGDVLYQQYKDNYINQGKQAMIDTMGQASAMTGGYGNSYAATVGNQTYQGYLQNLNNVIPELYQMALDRYNSESDRLTNNLNVLGTDRQLAQSEYDTKYTADLNRLTSDRDYYADNYNTAYNRDYTSYSDMVNSNNTNYWNEYNAGYQAEQDAIANALNERQMAINEANLKINQDAQRIAELQAGVTRDESGNISSVAATSKYADEDIPQYILDKLSSFDNDFDIDDYLYDLELNGTLTNQQAKELAATYYLNNTVAYDLNGTENRYYLLDDGGINWGGGIDNNAKVKVQSKDEKGNIIIKEQTLKDIFDELVGNNADKETKSKAKEKVIALQKKLGA